MAERTWHSYKQRAPIERFDAIVIGSGIGGLSAAALLARYGGQRVLVLERHYTVGGYTHVFRRPGYEWDVGVHYVGQVGDLTSPVRRLFDVVTDRELSWAPMPEIYDRIVIGDTAYNFVAGRDRLRNALTGYFPHEASAIRRYFDTVDSCVGTTQAYFAEKALPGPIGGAIGGLLRLRFMRHARQTTLQVLRSLTRNQELIAVLAGQYGDYGLPPAQSSFAIHAIVTAHYFDGAWYPVGGAGRLAVTIAPLIEAAGGLLLVSAEVKSILLEGGRAVGVRMADGRELRAPIIVSDAGAVNPLQRLLPQQVTERLGLVRALGAVPASSGHLCLYVGLKQTAEELGLTGTNLWIYPDADHDGNFHRFQRDPTAPFPVLYISFPSAKDPSFQERFPGRATIEVVTLAPFEWFERWTDTAWQRRGDDYNAFKGGLTSRLLAQLETHVPQVKGKVDHAELSTPLSTRHFMGHPHGEIYGLAPTPARFELRLRAQTPIPGLFLTGQDLGTPGVTGALFAGAITASAILRRNVLKDLWKEDRQ